MNTFINTPIKTEVKLDHRNIIAFITDIFERKGADSYLGESVTMAEHMLQGALLAEKNGADAELIAAALLHDIGHYTSEFPADMVGAEQDNYHEQAGARLLEPFFPARLVACVRHHVAAKRYLCAVEPSYYAQLSVASQETLRLQGGPMTAPEVAEFAANLYIADIIQIRRWDDAGKDPAQVTPDFSYYQPLLEQLVKRAP